MLTMDISLRSSVPADAGGSPLQGATREQVQMKRLFQMHTAFQSKPAMLTHAHNPIFSPPSFKDFLNTMHPKGAGSNKEPERQPDVDDPDNVFVQALDLNGVDGTDLLNEDAVALGSSAVA